MRKFKRAESPDFLTKKWHEWGNSYKENKTKNSGFTFQWPNHESIKINVILKPLLAQLTGNHCSYCDDYPLKTKADSIDHFKPKSRSEFFELVCQWENLFYCCTNCQNSKKEKFHVHLLRADRVDFSFSKYFIYDYTNHKIEPNPFAEKIEQESATISIEIFGLNDPGHVSSRRISLNRYNSQPKDKSIFIDDFPYRYILENI
ncbi:MAG TPA: hypothetical protein PK736_02795 [Bacteroidia bacterium]|nr:hypothetical protein [Bacteroidia bacterium]